MVREIRQLFLCRPKIRKAVLQAVAEGRFAHGGYILAPAGTAVHHLGVLKPPGVSDLSQLAAHPCGSSKVDSADRDDPWPQPYFPSFASRASRACRRLATSSGSSSFRLDDLPHTHHTFCHFGSLPLCRRELSLAQHSTAQKLLPRESHSHSPSRPMTPCRLVTKCLPPPGPFDCNSSFAMSSRMMGLFAAPLPLARAQDQRTHSVPAHSNARLP